MGGFPSCGDDDVSNHWVADTLAHAAALPYLKAGDSVFISDGAHQTWVVVEANAYVVGATAVNCTVATTCQLYLPPRDGLRNSRYKATSLAQMQAIATAQVGDDCVVSLAGSDALWLFVASGKYAHGANCLAGVGGDWLYQIDRLTGQTNLVGGEAFVYIPGIDVSSVPKAWYMSLSVVYGTIVATMTTNGINIKSTSPDDGSLVGYEVVIYQ
jgi:hypothetical protein